MTKDKPRSITIIECVLGFGALLLIGWLLDNLPDIIRFLLNQF